MSAATDAAPLIRVVAVNYNGGDLTIACLRSILASDWPVDRLEIVLVDNASSDGIADRVERELPSVRLIRSAANRGFAGGCNLGLADLGDVAYAALVNNDATVEPGWLAPLVDALVSDPTLGAACPKIVFADKLVELVLTVPTHRRGRGDRRDLGVRLHGAGVDDVDVWPRVHLVEGFWGREADGPGEWTAAHARLWLPAGAAAQLALSADAPMTVRVQSDSASSDLEVGTERSWHPVPLSAAITVINNVGSVLTADDFGADRGYLDPDDGRYDEPVDVFSWCGAAALLRRAYLDDVGHFDERLFLYYEDLELAWRGAKRRWRYRYVPRSVVHHVHAATSGEGSTRKHYYEDRNRLLVLTRHAPARRAWRAITRYLLATASYARRDVLSRVLRGTTPRPSIAVARLHAFAGYVVRAAPMLRTRRRDRSAAPRPGAT